MKWMGLMEEVRLQKFLAQSGVASRRKAEELIVSGRVCVNGKIITELGVKVLENDNVEVDGKKVCLEEKKVYVMLNKPVGYVTTVKDQFSRSTVLDLLQDIKERVYPVGRLDYDTSGLLILTNDGEFTYRLSHPKHEIEKTYIAQVEGVPNKEEVEAFENGLNIEGIITAAAKLEIFEANNKSSVLKITIHEGRNRQVRKMCASINHPVHSLKRVSIGKLEMGDLPCGKWRHLSEDEIKWLG